MIHYVTGNLLAASDEALINTVNTVGVMGKESPCNSRIGILIIFKYINTRVKRAAFSQANCW